MVDLIVDYKALLTCLAEKTFLKNVDDCNFNEAIKVLKFTNLAPNFLWNCLLKLARAGKFEDFNNFIDQDKLDLSLNVDHGKDLLINATIGANEQIVKWVLEKTLYNVNYQDYKGNTALHYAAKLDSDYILHLLLEYNSDADANILNNEEMTALQMAVLNGKVQTYEILAKVTSDQDRKCKSKNTLLHLAVIGGNRQLVEKFSKNVEMRNLKNDDGETPLCLAAKHGNTNTMQTIMFPFEHCDVPCKISITAIMNALKSGKKENYTFLIKYIDIDSKEKLINAIKGGNAELFEIVLNENLQYYKTETDHYELYKFAIECGNYEICRILFEAGFDVNSRCGYMTPLELASMRTRSDIFALMIRNGANFKLKGYNGETTICRAIRHFSRSDNIKKVEFLHTIAGLENHKCENNCRYLLSKYFDGEFIETFI